MKKHLETDEEIKVGSTSIIVTNGCQEALALLCINELKNENDCVLTIDPSYVGFSGLLQSLGKKIETVDASKLCRLSEDGRQFLFNWQHLKDRVLSLKEKGVYPKAIYTNFDFNNPLTYQLSHQDRIEFLAACNELEIKIIEDNPYSKFNYTGNSVRTLKSLDRYNIVYYVGSFAKTLCPALRVGYLAVPETGAKQAEQLVSIKSFLSVNTSSLSQSIVGGFLIDHKFSLNEHMKPIALGYKLQRDAMISALEYQFSEFPNVTWTVPSGGMFIIINLPFEITEKDVSACIRDKGIIFMPVSFFSLNPKLWFGKVRLSFSYYEPGVLHEAIKRFASYIKQELDRRGIKQTIISKPQKAGNVAQVAIE